MNKNKGKVLSKIVLTAIVPLAVLAGMFILPSSASAAGVIPEMDLITGYSSTGGTTEFKDNAQDLIYKIQQGDVITFSITPTSTSETINYLWQVRQGQVLASSIDITTYNWTVPSATSTWEIEIEATLKDGMGNTIGRESVNWSITTSDLKTVNPGESIQAAIDSLPVEGGIVELAAGTYNINSSLRINKSNVTMVGVGIDSTTITTSADPMVFVITRISLG